MPEKQTVIGRFAPSPTGPLHLGSLYTALASFLQARSQQGRWLLRIDDLDTPRNRPGSVASILDTLDKLGLHWDGGIAYQSRQLACYQDKLDYLLQNHWLYRCGCSRKMPGSENYSGHCRNHHVSPGIPHALRLKTDTWQVIFDDLLQGLVTEQLSGPHSDFIVKRKDHVIAYQFAVVVDDHLQQVNEIVRGCDLLTSTPKQIYLQQLLGYPTPRYVHVPVIIDRYGFKLSKQTLATAVDTHNPSALIFNLLDLLKQQPPKALTGASVTELLNWAVAHWHPEALKNTQTLSIS
ncbi:MAG: tRNA glutamyl-Q(34) synthetase GluQRS [Methylovulum sp.]|uniref:tRNA glutamyl-Q(34) synthetase GluQRS n=1 Tax=Methylovulum sp. TaxID=1916980 RepID=UPI00260187EE|nr:tRNA glutamyl-Q(34) synthetase GluQRS [Methylovulum sp.]MDD2724652.1 tRNA glutamyl-Q(34) synthetase GluQRS [Methylovulum sp.]MDD5123479.1 tRNA glutamyl-Q(34) synthetase GluQRS [Methylovulum sp.]